MQRVMARRMVGFVAGLTLALAVGCSGDRSPFGTDGPDPSLAQAYPAPAGLVTAAGFQFLPYTLNHYFAGNQDPINLIFSGNVNPLNLRAGLLGRQSVFGCVWKDALGGDEQVTYAGGAWAGSIVQLACGDYQPVRIHLRLFPAGDHTVGNAHFEVMIPGTADHQVLSWAMAEQVVWYDYLLAGIAQPLDPTVQINDAPTYRYVPAVIFNELPGQLQAVVTGAPGDLPEGVPAVGIPNGDGMASTLYIFGEAALTPGNFEQHITLPYGIIAPKPICNPDGDKYIQIGGSVDLWQVDVLTATGEYSREFRANGQLTVTPVNPMTGEMGEPQQAIVRQEQFAKFWPGMASTSRRFMQTLVPVASDEGGRASMFLQWGPNGKTVFDASEKCGS